MIYSNKGWSTLETVQFSKELYNNCETNSEQDDESSFELVSNLAYEVITVWNCDRAIDFAVEITKSWSFTQKVDFV